MLPPPGLASVSAPLPRPGPRSCAAVTCTPNVGWVGWQTFGRSMPWRKRGYVEAPRAKLPAPRPGPWPGAPSGSLPPTPCSQGQRGQKAAPPLPNSTKSGGSRPGSPCVSRCRQRGESSIMGGWEEVEARRRCYLNSPTPLPASSIGVLLPWRPPRAPARALACTRHSLAGCVCWCSAVYLRGRAAHACRESDAEPARPCLGRQWQVSR
jgi:hypothetical protein